MSARANANKDAIRSVGELLERAPKDPKERVSYMESVLRSSLLEREIQLLESYSLFYGQGSGPGTRYLGEDPRTDDGYEPWDEIGIGGQARRFVRTARDLEIARDIGRALAAENEFAIGAHECRQSYTVGAGLVYSVVPLEESAADMAKRCQAELEEFFAENDWPEMEQETVWRGDRDGEAFLRCFPNATGPMRVRFVEPESVTSDGAGSSIPPLGVEHAPEDVRDVHAIWVRPPSGGAPARVSVVDEATGLRVIEHLRMNSDAAALRGWPTMYPIRRNLARAEKLLRNMSFVAALQAAIALIRKHESATRSEVESYLDRERDLLVTNSATGRETRYQQMGAGTVIDAGPGVSYEAPVSSVNAGNNVAVLQAELRAAAARLQMPEYMFSGDACFTEDTELLTESGWRTLDTLRSEDRVASVVPSMDGVEFSRPIKHWGKSHDGEILLVATKNVDVAVTLNHDLWIGKRRWEAEPAWSKVQAGALGDAGQNVFMACALDIDGSADLDPSPVEGVSPADWWRFVGLYLGDGSAGIDDHRVQFSVKKQRKVDAFGPLLKRMGFTSGVYGDRHVWYSDDRALHELVSSRHGQGAHNKTVGLSPEDLFRLSRPLREALLSGLTDSDGHARANGMLYTTTSKRLADDVQLLGASLGLRSAIATVPARFAEASGAVAAGPRREVYRVHLHASPVATVWTHKAERLRYTGRVWCVEVPTGLVLCRRNGKVSVQGNSNANYGSTLVAEAPAVKQFLRLQGKYGRIFRRIASTALRHAAHFGRLPAEAVAACSIKIGYPTVIVRDQLQEAQRRQIEHASGVLSRRTWREQAGYDHDTEERNLDSESGDEEGDPRAGEVDPDKPPPGSTSGGPGGEDQKSTGSMVAESRLTEQGDEIASLREALESERLRAIESERALAELGGRLSGLERAMASPQVAAGPVINLTVPPAQHTTTVDARTTIEPGAVQAPVTIAEGAVRAEVDARTTVEAGAVKADIQVAAPEVPGLTINANFEKPGAKRVTFERGPDGKPTGAVVSE